MRAGRRAKRCIKRLAEHHRHKSLFVPFVRALPKADPQVRAVLAALIPEVNNIAAPGESRILNAPLAVQAGGWGQIAEGVWGSRNAPGYQKMAELVAACIPEMNRNDLNGTCGGGNRCSCGCCWVRLLRAEQKKGEGYKKTALAR